MKIWKRGSAKLAACALLVVSMFVASAPIAAAKTAAKAVAKKKTTVAVVKKTTTAKKPVAPKVKKSTAKKTTPKKKVPAKKTTTAAPKTSTVKPKASTSTSKKVTKETVPTAGGGSVTVNATQEATQSVAVGSSTKYTASKAKKAAKPKAATTKVGKVKSVPVPVVGTTTGDTAPEVSVTTAFEPDPVPDTVPVGLPRGSAPVQQQKQDSAGSTFGLAGIMGSGIMGLLVAAKQILTGI